MLTLKCIGYAVAGAVAVPAALIVMAIPLALSLHWFDNPLWGTLFLLCSLGAAAGGSLCRSQR